MVTLFFPFGMKTPSVQLCTLQFVPFRDIIRHTMTLCTLLVNPTSIQWEVLYEDAPAGPSFDFFPLHLRSTAPLAQSLPPYLTTLYIFSCTILTLCSNLTINLSGYTCLFPLSLHLHSLLNQPFYFKLSPWLGLTFLYLLSFQTKPMSFQATAV